MKTTRTRILREDAIADWTYELAAAERDGETVYVCSWNGSGPTWDLDGTLVCAHGDAGSEGMLAGDKTGAVIFGDVELATDYYASMIEELIPENN